MTAMIEIQGLRKEYRRLRGGRTVAVAGLDLEVPEGGVFGFLGPNGSGKTTTIRCMLGLARSTAGSMRVLGRPSPGALTEVMPCLGAIIETPAMFPTMSGRENLRLLGAIDRIGARRVEAVLERVGLAPRADDKVRKYSLGMRQRLGLAAALLKDPALIVLDEPTNGLDPAGIRETRELLKGLGAEGRTVFVSSHLLAEVEQTCDEVAIISRGLCVLTGRVDEVLSAAASPALLVALGDVEAGRRVLLSAGLRVEVVGPLLRVAEPSAEAARVTKLLADNGLYLTEMRREVVTLEDLFLEITDNEERSA